MLERRQTQHLEVSAWGVPHCGRRISACPDGSCDRVRCRPGFAWIPAPRQQPHLTIEMTVKSSVEPNSSLERTPLRCPARGLRPWRWSSGMTPSRPRLDLVSMVTVGTPGMLRRERDRDPLQRSPIRIGHGREQGHGFGQRRAPDLIARGRQRHGQLAGAAPDREGRLAFVAGWIGAGQLDLVDPGADRQAQAERPVRFRGPGDRRTVRVVECQQVVRAWVSPLIVSALPLTIALLLGEVIVIWAVPCRTRSARRRTDPTRRPDPRS